MARRVKINRASFRALVRGEILSWEAPGGETIEVVLSDIGFGQMLEAVHDAECHQIHLKLGLPARRTEETEDDG